MFINYDLTKISSTLLDFYIATGINIQLVNKEFTEVYRASQIHNEFCETIQKCPNGKNKCICSDKFLLGKCKKSKKAEMHICHAGLVDLAIPVIYNNSIISYVILGQMKEHHDFSKIADKLSSLDLGLDLATMKEHYLDLTYFDHKKIKSISTLAVMTAQFLLLEDMLSPRDNYNLELAINFINENLHTRLTINTISKSTGISPSSLYSLFHKSLNCTINEYINKTRVEKAAELLKHTDLSMEEISQKVGFSSAAYFTINFKKVYNMPPLKYKKTYK